MEKLNLPNILEDFSDEELSIIEQTKLIIKGGIPLELGGTGTNRTGIVEKYKSKCVELQSELSLLKNRLKYLVHLERKGLQKYEGEILEDYTDHKNRDDRKSMMLNQDSVYYDKSSVVDKYECMCTYLDELFWILKSLISGL